jgi:hypothetical protein
VGGVAEKRLFLILERRVSVKIDVLNIPVFQAMLEVFAQTIDDERIPEDVRGEYNEKYKSIMLKAEPSGEEAL